MFLTLPVEFQLKHSELAGVKWKFKMMAGKCSWDTGKVIKLEKDIIQ